MKLIDFKKVKDGKFIKNYELKYLNNEGKEKIFEIISHNDYESASEIGQKSSGVSIVALDESLDRMLILKEFRMGVNKQIYNLCAGRMEKGETVENCIKRELLEESGLELKRVVRILPPSFAAVALSDIKNQIAIVVVKGTPTGKNASANEWIVPDMYSKSEALKLVENEEFTSRAQLATYMFAMGAFDNLCLKEAEK